MSVKFSVAPSPQLLVVKLNTPCGRVTPLGGDAEVNCDVAKPQPTPPPVKLAVMLPLPVADGAV